MQVLDGLMGKVKKIAKESLIFPDLYFFSIYFCFFISCMLPIDTIYKMFFYQKIKSSVN